MAPSLTDHRSVLPDQPLRSLPLKSDWVFWALAGTRKASAKITGAKSLIELVMDGGEVKGEVGWNVQYLNWKEFEQPDSLLVGEANDC